MAVGIEYCPSATTTAPRHCLMARAPIAGWRRDRVALEPEDSFNRALKFQEFDVTKWR